MYPTPETIAQYIATHASPTSIARGMRYEANEEEITDKKASYFCYGSQGAIYRITINYSKKLNVKCTCPYSFGGICKHSVAALEALAKHIRSKQTGNRCATP